MLTTDTIPTPRPGAVIITGALSRVRTRRAGAVTFTGEPPSKPEPVRRPAKIARLLALAHHIEAAIEEREYKDRADAARQLGVTRARISQIMDLALLAPDIQEWLLFTEAVDGVEPVREREMRGIVGDGSWVGQRGRWAQVRGG